MTNSTHSAPERALPTCDDFEAYDMRRADWSGMEDRMSEQDSFLRRSSGPSIDADAARAAVILACGLAVVLLVGVVAIAWAATAWVEMPSLPRVER